MGLTHAATRREAANSLRSSAQVPCALDVCTITASKGETDKGKSQNLNEKLHITKSSCAAKIQKFLNFYAGQTLLKGERGLKSKKEKSNLGPGRTL